MKYLPEVIKEQESKIKLYYEDSENIIKTIFTKINYEKQGESLVLGQVGPEINAEKYIEKELLIKKKEEVRKIIKKKLKEKILCNFLKKQVLNLPKDIEFEVTNNNGNVENILLRIQSLRNILLSVKAS